jgi:hypothetical protein
MTIIFSDLGLVPNGVLYPGSRVPVSCARALLVYWEYKNFFLPFLLAKVVQKCVKIAGFFPFLNSLGGTAGIFIPIECAFKQLLPGRYSTNRSIVSQRRW